MNIEIKEDRRVRKTKKALREGLIELLNEKSIQSITVRELTDKVDIHRSTFYANFKDVYELYSHMEDTIIQEISEIVDIDSTDYANNTFQPYVFFNALLDYINKNRQIARLFFGGNISTAFFERLTGLFKDACIECWLTEYKMAAVSKEMDYYIQFSLSGGLGVIGMWVSKDFEYPMEKLVDMLTNLDANVSKTFGCEFPENTL